MKTFSEVKRGANEMIEAQELSLIKQITAEFCEREEGLQRLRQRRYSASSLLESLILMMMKGVSSINQWRALLADSPNIREHLGFGDRNPQVATYYHLIYRVERLLCSEVIPRVNTARHSHSKLKQRARGVRGATQKGEVGRALDKALKGERVHTLSAFSAVMNRLLHLFVRESVRRQLITPEHVSSLDGTLYPSWSQRRQKSCECGPKRCDHERIYADPTADLGYSPTKKSYVFGHRVSALVARNLQGQQRDLPVDVMVAKTCHGENTLAMEQLITLKRESLRAVSCELLGRYLAADSGYSIAEVYQLSERLGLTAVIAPKKAQQSSDVEGEMKVLGGVPRCASGQAMTFHAKSASRGSCFRCPARRALRGGGMRFERERCFAEVPCDTERRFGPVTYVKPGAEQLYQAVLKRDSEEYKLVYAQRGSVERFFSVLKAPSRLIRTRRVVILQALLVFQAINVHVQAWLKQDREAARMSKNTS